MTLLVLLCGALWWWSLPASACDCTLPTPEQSFEYADVAFEGTLVAVDQVPVNAQDRS